MITQELISYMKEASRRGMSYEKIEEQLLQVGWSKEDIVRCYEIVQQPVLGQQSSNSLVQTTMTEKEAAISTPITSSLQQPALQQTPLTQKKAGSPAKVFFFLLFLVIVIVAGVVYSGIFLTPSIIQRSLVRSFEVAPEIALRGTFSFSYDMEQETFSYDGSFDTRLVPETKKLSSLLMLTRGRDEVLFDGEFQTIDPGYALLLRQIPEEQQLSSLVGQWIAVTSFTDTNLFPQSSFLVPKTVLQVWERDVLRQIVQTQPLFARSMAPRTRLENSTIQYEVPLTLTPEIRSQIQTVLVQELTSTRFSQAEKDQFIKVLLEQVQVVGFWDIRMQRFTELILRAESESAPLYFKLDAVLEFNSEISSAGIPSENLVPLESRIEALVPEEPVLSQFEQQRTLFTQIIAEERPKQYFTEKKSFVGICALPEFTPYQCRATRTGFVLFTQEPQEEVEQGIGARVLCIDAFTDTEPSIGTKLPTGNRCVQ